MCKTEPKVKGTVAGLFVDWQRFADEFGASVDDFVISVSTYQRSTAATPFARYSIPFLSLLYCYILYRVGQKVSCCIAVCNFVSYGPI